MKTTRIFGFNTDELAWRLRLGQNKQDDPIKEIIQNSIAASCTVIVYKGRQSMNDAMQWTGSGFHVGNGVVITAAHVAPADTPLQVALSFDGANLYPATIIASEPKFDVALLHCPAIADNISSVKLADSDNAEVGDIIAVIASPEGWTDTATVGRISNVHQTLGDFAPSPAWNDIMFIDADILEGSSGGMVIGTDGLVYGAVMGVTGQHANMGIGQRAICPSNKIQNLLHRLEQASIDMPTRVVTARLKTYDEYLAERKSTRIYNQLRELAPKLAEVAQQVYDEWTKTNGSSDLSERIATAMVDVINSNINSIQAKLFTYNWHKRYCAAMVVENALDGDREINLVSIPTDVYASTGGDYFTKIRHAHFTSDMIEVEPIDESNTSEESFFATIDPMFDGNYAAKIEHMMRE